MKAGSLAVWCAAVLACAGCAAGSSVAPVSQRALDATHRANAAGTPSFRVFTAGSTPGLPVTAVPRDIAAGPGGTMWFTDYHTPAIGSISPSFKIREYATGLGTGALPYAIVAGPDGNMWFSDADGAIGRITPAGTISEFRSALLAKAAPAGLVAGPDKAFWALALGPPSFLLRVTLDGAISSSPIPNALIPDGSLAADAAGNIWFFASRTDRSYVLVQRTRDGRLVVHPMGLIDKGEQCCPNLSTEHIVIGFGGNPWFTTPYAGVKNSYSQIVGTFASAGATLFDVKSAGYLALPSGIASAPHALWFAGSNPLSFDGALWRIDALGRQIVYPIPYDPAGLAAFDDTTLWFTSQAQGRAPQIVEAVF
jgi:virginiamycin B lyase